MVYIDGEWWGQETPELALQLTPKEPQLTLDVRGKPIKLLADTGATYLYSEHQLRQTQWQEL